MADIDDLKAAYDQLVTAINARNLNAWVGSYHEQHVGIAGSSFFVDGRAAVRQVGEVLFANTESLDWKSVSPQFRIIGGTGIAWGHVAYTVKPKDGPLRTLNGAYIITFTKAEGKWLGITAQFSPLQSEY
jgi:ketosteroid isomerase-like protein